MVTLYFDKIFNPRSVAIVGASDEEGTVGYALIKNFTELGFAGKVYPVNIRKTEILGLGTKMVDHVIDICKDMGVETIYGIMLPDNKRAINLIKKMVFTITYLEDSTVKGTVNLKEEETECIEPQTLEQAPSPVQAQTLLKRKVPKKEETLEA